MSRVSRGQERPRSRNCLWRRGGHGGATREGSGFPCRAAAREAGKRRVTRLLKQKIGMGQGGSEDGKGGAGEEAAKVSAGRK